MGTGKICQIIFWLAIAARQDTFADASNGNSKDSTICQEHLCEMLQDFEDRVADFQTEINILNEKVNELTAGRVKRTTPASKADCEAQADIVFLLDSSGSVGSGNFQKMKSFVHDLMNSFNIGPGAVQVGVDTFQTTVKSEFHMNTYHDRQFVQNAINKIPYSGGNTNTAAAIKFMATDNFSAARGDRQNVPNVAIVVTDGQSNNPTQTAAEAKKARDAGITLLAIGIGSGVSKTELNAIATDPDSTHVFTADNFDALKSLQALLSTTVCDELEFVAFSSYNPVSLFPVSGSTIVFGSTQLNEGNAYSTTTGKFTVPYDGVYEFNANICNLHGKFIVYNINRNGKETLALSTQWDDTASCGSVNALARLNAGDEVFLRCDYCDSGVKFYENVHRRNTFSGVLLHKK